MDDLNRRMQEAQRARARAAQAVLEEQFAARAPDDAPPVVPEEPGAPLTLVEEGGAPRYVVGEHALVDGDALEVLVHRAGWVPGRFRWNGEPDRPPELLVRLARPEDPLLPVGEAVLTLPDQAPCRKK